MVTGLSLVIKTQGHLPNACSHSTELSVISLTMVKRVVYSYFTDEQTKALRLDPQPQGTWLGSSSAQTLVCEPPKPLLLALPNVASLTALQGDQVAPGSNFSSGFPQDSRYFGREFTVGN